MSRARQAIFPIFVPHAGCAQRCSFCDQRAISGALSVPTPAQVRQMLTATTLPAQKAQIAFYGGSFTAIDPDVMEGLLSAAAEFVRPGGYGGIRFSTRPDALGDAVLTVLSRYPIQTVEIGAQSMDDAVLAANGRGHTAADTAAAAQAVRAMGWEPGLQMMTGLYQSSPALERETARRLLALSPAFLRIYPVAVFEHTELAALWRAGLYTPPTVEETVPLGADLLEMAEAAGVPVIRLGLHSDLAPGAQPLCGAFHPALGELCLSRLLLRRIEAQIAEAGFLPGSALTVFVAPNRVSAAAGQKRENSVQLKDKGYTVRVRADEGLTGNTVRVEENGACS